MARIMLTLPDDMLREIDQVARREHRSRSEFLRETVRSYLRSAKRVNRSNQDAIGIIERLRTQAMERAQRAHDSVELIRSFRGPLEEAVNDQ